MLEVEFVQLSDAGTVRDRNEDFAAHSSPGTPEEGRDYGWLFVLADGVGGHDRGEVASSLAVETVLREFRGARPAESLLTLLRRAIERANVRVYETAMSTGPGGSSMATTLVACGLRYDRAVIAHVGDSRCYILRQGEATQITRDHTFAAEQMRMGLLTTREASTARTSHVLSRSVGGNMFVNVDVADEQIFAGDVLVLCSDGLHNSVAALDYVRVVQPDCVLEKAAQQLVALAKERDGGDNISVQLVRIRDVERMGMYRGRQYKLR